MMTLSKQEEADDDDEWNPCKAAGVCIMLLATCTEDDIVPHVLPFVKDNIKHQNWRLRDAAIMAFGEFNVILFLFYYCSFIYLFISFNFKTLQTVSRNIAFRLFINAEEWYILGIDRHRCQIKLFPHTKSQRINLVLFRCITPLGL